MTPKDEVIKIVSGPTGAVAVGTTPVKAAPAAVKVAEPAAAVQPANVTAPDATAAATPKTYTVQRGDTLGRISQKYYKGRLSDLLRTNPQFTANGRNPNLIFPGDRVIIPG
jgi:nucleoid-associated protein YgaU